MKSVEVLIVTEANERVASGHLFECMACKEYLNEKGILVDLMVNSDMVSLLKSRIKDTYFEYITDIQTERDYLIDFLRNKQYTIVVFNLRKISQEFIDYIKKNIHIKILCIDELGRRKLESDIIINPMIDSYYWNYDTKAQLYCGNKYLILPKNIVLYHTKKKTINETIKVVSISMGGVDRPGSTVKLVKWLLEYNSDIILNVILGGGFLQENKLLSVIKSNTNVEILKNISNIYDYFYDSDLVICAGGNTLHELAVIGTPAIVVPSMPHEKRNGMAFQKKGFSFCCDLSKNMTKEKFIIKYNKIADFNTRKEMSKSGKIISDGKGAERVCELILQYVNGEINGVL